MFERVEGTGVDDPLAPYRAVERVAPAGRAWVLANMVAGLDGTAAIGGRVADLSSPLDARLFRRLRALADVVLVGARTVRQERYGPIQLDDDLRAERAVAGRGLPRVAIVSSSLDLDPQLPVFAKAADNPPVLVTSARSAASWRADVPAEVVVAGDDRVDVRAAIAALAARGHGVVLCEGGPSLLGQLVAADLLDEYCLTISPLIGGDPLPVIDTSGLRDLTRFRLHHVYSEDSTLFLNYRRERSS